MPSASWGTSSWPGRQIDALEEQKHLRGSERGAFAARRAAQVAASMPR